MPSTFTENTGIELIADGEQSGLWGQTTNDNFEIVDRALNGSVNISLSGTTHTLTTASGVLSDGQFAVLVFTGSPSGTNTVTIEPNTAQKTYFVTNSTAQTVILSQGSGANVSVPAGLSKIVFTNGAGAGAAVFDITNTLSGTFTGNASTATALQTARTIGGVSFNGTANIDLPGVNIGGNQNTTGSAASLTTARTFTIGATGKTFNGTANVAWSLAEIGVGTLGQQAANNVDINGGTIDGTVIGGSTPAAISGTTGSFSGNVGIGTSFPTEALDVAKSSSGANSDLLVLRNSAAPVVGAGARAFFLHGTGNVAGSTATGGIQSFVSQSSPSLAGDLRFSTNSGGSLAERMRITSTGSVGIGTSNPAAKLHVFDTGSSTEKLIVRGPETGSLADFSNGLNANFIVKTATFLTTVGSSVSASLAFQTSGSEHLRITSAGSVGIGTSSPAAKLEVLGSSNSNYLRLSGDDAAGARGLDFTSFTVNANAGAGHQINAKSIHGTLTFATSNTERLRIDASGNLLVGKTVANTTSEGVVLANQSFFTRTDGNTAFFNRNTSDGNIIAFGKDGTTVGSIGSRAGVTSHFIADPRAGGAGITAVGTQIRSTDQTGALVDGTIDLGGASNRWKDLFLSGGVFLGGTGSANLLDDYEEGTWTPTLVGNTTAGDYTVTVSTGSATYVKVGKIVHVAAIMTITVNSAGTGLARFGGLPFTSGGNTRGIGPVRTSAVSLPASTLFAVSALFTSNTTNFGLSCIRQNAGFLTLDVSGISSTNIFDTRMTYETA